MEYKFKLHISKVSFLKKFFVECYEVNEVDSVFNSEMGLADTQIRECRDRMNNLSVGNESYKKQVESLKEEIDEKDKMIESLKIENEHIIKDKSDALNNNSRLVTEKEQMLKDIAELKKELETIKRDNDKKLRELKRKHSEELSRTIEDQKSIGLKKELVLKERTIKELKQQLESNIPNVKVKGQALTCQQVHAILTYIKEGKALKDIAEQYKVSRSAITRIKQGKNYKDCIEKYNSKVTPPINPIEDGEDL